MKLAVFSNALFLESFTKLIELELPARTAYRLSKIHKKIIEESEAFEGQRKKLIEKFADRSEDGEMRIDDVGNVLLQKDKIHDINKEFSDLMDIEFQVDSILIQELGDLKIDAKTLTILSDVITLE